MKKILVSLNCSGESFEKTISLYYLSYLTNSDFYDKYNVQLFYSHNLPKKNKNICSHGTIGFYEKYFSHLNFIPSCSKNYIIDNKNEILSHLAKKRIISYRRIEIYKNNDNAFWNYIKNIPFEYIYPEFIDKIRKKMCEKFNLKGIDNLYLESNYMNVIKNIGQEYWRYNIYGLNYNGIIGKYDVDLGNFQSVCHLYNSLKYNSVLSGNSAIFLCQIKSRMNGNNIIYGYRKHNKNPRPNRNYELSRLLTSNDSIIEPKNDYINNLFDEIKNVSNMEEKANIVYAKAYLKFLCDNYNILELGDNIE